MIILYAKKNCKFCHGDGTFYDTVPYGSTTAQLPSDCECIFEDIDDITWGKIEHGADYEILPSEEIP